ncbi:SGNH/GDSL hydrolase family protein [Sutcliffiella rhizosphaerae]|uniref:SGNH hydrolase-type esterase domain-containing protein n=1 Tax=Sutcliffiella rhizosphaerae TaxID=2880967 RepID=A0ABN8A902_9BACI|nr:GDSL-type esterase/lipase family protein [Sutcliffiella rhizosphaerae]CAG9621613.1 hypothetical protein BACCIP111883_02386 [Sutcliffiella rhizosphaerae]
MKLKHLSILFAVLLVFNLFTSTTVFAEAETKPKIVALGDSIPFGTSLPEQTLPFPHLLLNGQTDVINLSIPGLQTEGLLTQITTNSEAKAAIQSADIITLNISNNDLLQAADINAIRQALLAGESIDFDLVEANVTLAAQAAFSNVLQILAVLTTYNDDATILFYNLYNPFPYVDTEPEQTLHSFGESILSAVNPGFATIPNIFSNTIVLDAYGAFHGKQAEFVYAAPDIHPTPAGHKALASLADQALKGIFPPEHPEPEPEPEPQYDLVLSATLEGTAATINIDTKGQAPHTLMWLPGDREITDFIDNPDVNLLTNTFFEVTENGIYSVLALFHNDTTTPTAVLKKIEITNIVPPKGDPPTEEPPVEEEPPIEEPPVEEENKTPPPVKVDDKKDQGKKKPESKNESKKGNKLPNTATGANNYILWGSALFIAGIAVMTGLFYFRRKVTVY